MTPDFADITAQMQLYFDGLYHSDVSLLEQVFHPQAHYICATENPLLMLDMAAYFPVVAKRTAPASRNERRRDKIVSIQFAGPDAALVRAHGAIGDKYFTDLLSFIRVDGTWQIISKVFHYDLMSDAVI